MTTHDFGDPDALRQLAARLRSTAAAVEESLARTRSATELGMNRGAAADRARETAAGLRERGSRIAHRADAVADELDRGARWVEQARLDALARQDAW